MNLKNRKLKICALCNKLEYCYSWSNACKSCNALKQWNIWTQLAWDKIIWTDKNGNIKIIDTPARQTM